MTVAFDGIEFGWDAYTRWKVSRTRTARSAGFEILCDRDVPPSVRDAAEIVVDALALIQEVDPARFERLRRDMPRILVTRARWPQYWINRALCVLPADRVESAPAHELALALVHEATHARIHRAGVPWRLASYQRIEQRCVRSEIAFCRALAAAGWKTDERVNWYTRRLNEKLYRASLPWAFPIRLVASIVLWPLWTVLARIESDRRVLSGTHPPAA